MHPDDCPPRCRILLCHISLIMTPHHLISASDPRGSGIHTVDSWVVDVKDKGSETATVIIPSEAVQDQGLRVSLHTETRTTLAKICLCRLVAQIH